MIARNRVVEVRELPASQIYANPRNFKSHPDRQVDGMKAILEEIGIADVLVVYRSEREDGRLTLVDGAMRRSLDERAVWPCAITDLTDEEADKLLAVHDPITAMASQDDSALKSLVSGIQAETEGFQRLLSGLVKQDRATVDRLPEPESPPDLEADLETSQRIESLALRPLESHHYLMVYCEDEVTWSRLLGLCGVGGPEGPAGPIGRSQAVRAETILGRLP